MSYANTVAVLFARTDSIYKTLPGCDVYDIERDALTFPGGLPVVAHPPCRAWGNLRWNANPRPGEKDLAPWAINQIRQWGGVLEHPRGSSLWDHCRLPPVGKRDRWGGWTLPVRQFDWGHKAEKATWLYIVGCEVDDIPTMPHRAGSPEFVVNRQVLRKNGTRIRRGDADYMPEITRAEREHTPPEFARWLVDLARLCGQGRMERAA